MADLPLRLALSSVLTAVVDDDRRGLLAASVPQRAGRLAPVVPLRPPARPGPGPDRPQAA